MGVGDPDISVDPTAFDFAGVLTGTSSNSQTLTILNTGKRALHVQDATCEGANASEFSIQNDEVSGRAIGPLQSKTLEVVFAPSSPGEKNATLVIGSDDPDENPVVVDLSGLGLAPAISVSPLSIDFGAIAVGSVTSPRTVTLLNVGSADLVVGQVDLSGEDASEFSVQTDAASGATLPPSASTSLQVAFAPSSPGEKNASLAIPSNDPNEGTVTLTLHSSGELSAGGDVPSPNISASVISYDFGEVTLGSFASLGSLVIANLGDSPLTLGTIALAGANVSEFGILNDRASGMNLESSETASLEVVFVPVSLGEKSVLLLIPSNDPDTNPLTVALSGSAKSPASSQTPRPDISVSPLASRFETTAVGSSSFPLIITVSNEGNGSLNIGSIRLGGADAVELSIQSDAASWTGLAPGGSATVEVVFNPTSGGEKIANVVIASDDPDENPVTVVLRAGEASSRAVLLPDLAGTWSKLSIVTRERYRSWANQKRARWSVSSQVFMKVLVTIKNLGQREASPCEVSLFLSRDRVLTKRDRRLAAYAIPSLTAGASRTLRFSRPLTKSRPRRYLLVVIDSGHQVDESNEKNNLILARTRNAGRGSGKHGPQTE